MTDESASPDEIGTVNFDVTATDAGARIDAYLASRMQGISRTRISRLIEDGDVLVSGRRVKPSYKLRGGEGIEVEFAPQTLDEVSVTPENIPLSIIHEDEDIIVIDKPAGLVVHPAAGVRSGTLANALAFHFQQHSRRESSAPRAGIVHRLDRETSGLMVVAKSEDAHEKLADQFRAREVFKRYVTLVHGRVTEDKGRIDQPLARDPRNRTRMAVVRGGRPAVTLFTVSRRYSRFTLLDVEIKTGRTHQIRVHMAWIKHPVVGDESYNAGRDKTVSDARLRGLITNLARQFLHAAELGFRHPRTSETVRFSSPLPAELVSFLNQIEAH